MRHYVGKMEEKKGNLTSKHSLFEPALFCVFTWTFSLMGILQWLGLRDGHCAYEFLHQLQSRLSQALAHPGEESVLTLVYTDLSRLHPAYTTSLIKLHQNYYSNVYYACIVLYLIVTILVLALTRLTLQLIRFIAPSDSDYRCQLAVICWTHCWASGVCVCVCFFSY